MKGMKKLIPALCLLLVSAILMGTSTYAWFSMNGTVTATGMKVKAQADEGILIKTASINFGDYATVVPAAAKTFKSTTDVNMATGTAVYPVSTIDASTWYKNNSDEFDDAKAAQAAGTYTEVTATSGYYAKFGFKLLRSPT